MWLLPKGAGGGECESCAASRWHSFGRHGMKGVVAALVHGGVLFVSTCEMYSYIHFNVTCTIICLLTLPWLASQWRLLRRPKLLGLGSSDSDRL
jgi:hypothetical protein